MRRAPSPPGRCTADRQGSTPGRSAGYPGPRARPCGRTPRDFPAFHAGKGGPIGAVIYTRVSTDEQAERRLSVIAQGEACRAHADRNGWPIRASYGDEGLSGSLPLDKRPGLLDAIDALERGDWLVVAKRDRLFRADPFDRAVIERAVARRGCRISSAAGEGTADDEPSSVLLRQIVDAMAQYERALIAARTRAVMRSKRGRGEVTGNVPIGSRPAADRRLLEPDPSAYRAAELARTWSAGGGSLRGIARRLTEAGIPAVKGGPWSASSVRTLLRLPPWPPNSSPAPGPPPPPELEPPGPRPGPA